MRIGQVIGERGGSLSFEFFPPKDEAGEEQLFQHIAVLESLNPTFVSVTYGAGGGTSKNTERVVRRIYEETSLTPMPHLTCVDQDRDELRRILENYKRLGIENVLALRGDPPQGTESFVQPENGFCYARHLVKLARSVSGFSIGVAVYPEGHPEAPDLETDIRYAKEKIDAGADFAITQMFFDNRYFYDFLERAERAGIRVPIIPGIMPITDINRIKKFSQQCAATLPDYIVRRFEKVDTKKDEARKIGIEVAEEQCNDLLMHGVRYFHFYTLNRSEVVGRIIKDLGLRKLGLANRNVALR